MTRVVLSGKVGREGTAIVATGSPAMISALRGSRDPSYMVRRIVMRHQHEAAEEVAEMTQRLVREKTPVRSRRTQLSIRRRVRRMGDTVLAIVDSDSPNIDRLEGGTGLYGPNRRLIRARRPGGLMRFPKRATGGFRLTDVVRTRGGLPDPRAKFVFARTVRGQKAHHMFRRSATEMRMLTPVIFRKHAKLAALEIKARL